jgi:hypothetical protein
MSSLSFSVKYIQVIITFITQVCSSKGKYSSKEKKRNENFSSFNIIFSIHKYDDEDERMSDDEKLAIYHFGTISLWSKIKIILDYS